RDLWNTSPSIRLEDWKVTALPRIEPWTLPRTTTSSAMRAPMIRARSPITMRWAWTSPWISPSICTSPFDSRLPVMARSAPMTEAEPWPRTGGLAATGGAAGASRRDASPVLPASDGPSRSGFLVNIDALLQEAPPHGNCPLNMDHGLGHRHAWAWARLGLKRAWAWSVLGPYAHRANAGFGDRAMVASGRPRLGRGQGARPGQLHGGPVCKKGAPGRSR